MCFNVERCFMCIHCCCSSPLRISTVPLLLHRQATYLPPLSLYVPPLVHVYRTSYMLCVVVHDASCSYSNCCFWNCSP